MLKFLSLLIAVTLYSIPVSAEKLKIGRVALPDEIAAWNIDIRPDGLGLPEGSGSALDGEELFSATCAACHGDFGEGVGRWPMLAGGEDTLADERPTKTVGSFWPYLSTVWDYIYRAMPYGNAQSLEPDEVYQLVAYILYLNDMVEEDFVLTRENFADFTMANAAGFIPDDRPQSEYPNFHGAPCMDNCKDTVEILKRANIENTVTGSETQE